MITFLYYSHTVDCTILSYLNTTSEQQANPNQNTKAEITHFLDCTATNPTAIVQYKASDMILYIDSDASYLSKPRARSCNKGNEYIGSLRANPKKAPNLPPLENGSIHIECRILKHVVASVAKEEVGRIFHNGETAVPLSINLNEISFPQPPTPIKTDITDTEYIFPATVRKKGSRKMDIRFY